MAGVWRQTQPKTRARMYGDKCEEDTAAAAVVVAHHTTPQRGPSRPGCGGPPGLAVVAQPHLPRVRARQGWVVIDVERLEEEVIISLYGAGGVGEAIRTGSMLAGLKTIFNQRAPMA